MICIGICTYKRPHDLTRLLQSLCGMDIVQEGRARILVVDNNPDGSAHATVTPWNASYVHEPRTGLAHARNRVVHEARALGASWLAFLDDDEIPSPGWLDTLIQTQRRFAADIVVGPIVQTLPANLGWAARYLHQPRHPTGTDLRFWSTGNVLLDLRAIAPVGLFNEKYVQGGEDTQFSVRCRLAGLKMVWCDEAEVYEPTDERRANAEWLIARSRVAGRIMTQVERDLNVGHPLRRRANGLFRVISGTLALVPGRLIGRTLRLRVFVARGEGMLERS